MESMAESPPRLEELTAEMAKEARRLQTQVEAGGITHEEAEEILQTHLAAHEARVRMRDKPH